MKDNYTLIGYPLGHSLSPRIHTSLFELAGIDAQYDLT
ncbi:MAG: shikimate dehydrogenase, partial [Ruminiclostridium sp.]|nr:shikimate dehydrogenase [Ruminiclostridium sp.]